MSPTTKYLLAYAGYVATVHLVDGPWRHWSTGSAVDGWTATHVAWGILAKKMGVPLGTFMALGALNEAGEALLRRSRPDLLWGSPETSANVAVDLAANYVGWRLG